jgi:adenosylcobinamide-GDP ribazoletransferase
MWRENEAQFWLSVQFLTRVPIPPWVAYTPECFERMVRFFPLTGALIGAAMAFVYVVALSLFPTSVAVVLMLAFGLALTGAFHEDGFADTFDGLGGGTDRAKILTIMKDSRLGTYGTAALVGLLLLKFVMLTSLPPLLMLVALVAAHSVSRLSSVVVMATSSYVREEGLHKPMATSLRQCDFLFAGVLTLLIVVAAFGFLPSAMWWVVLPAVAGCCVGHLMARWLFEKRLGGYTGDTLGCVQQLSEVGFILGVLACV